MSTDIKKAKGCLLALVLDVHPQLTLVNGATEHFLNAVICFANLHLAASVHNRLMVVAANHRETRILYPKKDQDEAKRQTDGRLELLSQVDDSIVDELKAMLGYDQDSTQTDSLLSGAIGRALLYIKRQESIDAITNKIHARILTIKTSCESAGQYLNYINMYLTAQKIGTAIDMCVVGSDCGLLQQGADITGGFYHRVNDMENLLQSLIMFQQSDITTRKKINLPPAASVDYRAACFCHRTLVDMGNVCSNCLSVYCKAVPLCSTCNVFFQMEMPFRKTNKKRK